MKILQFLFIESLFILNSCTSSQTYIEIPYCDKATYVEQAQYITDIILPTCNYSRYNSTYVYDGRYIYGVNVKSPNIIDVYDLNDKQRTFSIIVDESYVNDRISGLYVKSKDSIYFCQNSPNAVYLIDSLGHLVDCWKDHDLNIKSSDDKILSKYNITFPTFLGHCSPQIIDDIMLIPIDPSGMYNEYKYVNRVGAYDLNKREWIKFFSKQPNCRKGYSYPYDLEQPYITKGGSSIIISYPMDHYIYVYDSSNFSCKETIPCYSKYANNLSYPLKNERISLCQLNWNYRVQSPFYGPLCYHKEIDMYTRVYYHSQNLIHNGKVNNGENRKSSIIIMDSSFNIVGETIFENGQIGVYSSLPLFDGLLVSPQINEDTLKTLNYSKKIQIVPCI